MLSRFEASRENGHSDKMIIFDLVKNADPETLFEYGALRDALQEGTDREVTRQVIGAAVRSANQLLLRETQRMLAVVRGIGYRVARPEEHLGIALWRKDRAQGQLKHGEYILGHTRLDELSEAHRQDHILQWKGLTYLCQAISATQKRLDRHDSTIKNLIHRIERLEEK